MIKRITVHVAAVVSVATMAAGPAHAMDNRAFSINFYSDATYVDEVGFARAECNPDPVAVMQWGVSTDYQQINYVGECIDGQLYYY